jgi:putative membrane protein
MEFLLRLIISALAVLVTSFLLPGVDIDNGFSAILAAAVLSFLNAILKPVLVFLTIPITLFTFGLFLLAINALMILLTAKLVPGFHVSGFWTAMLFSIILSLVNAVFEGMARKQE